MKKLLGIIFIFFLVMAWPAIKTAYQLADLYNLLPQISYSNKDFDIETVTSSVDYNENGTDDYTDIMLGARADRKNKPDYDPSYVLGGYPPEDKGVCTDVVWRGFRNAGYSLRWMLDRDITLYPRDYPNANPKDDNIDFRRVKNLRVFFDKYAVELTTDINDIEQWQGGDIVIFKDNKHIGIVSDKRNADGQCYIIHNGGQPKREEDYFKRGEVLRHYRFDASLVPQEILVRWEGD
ncbi:MAG: DUF1287 domain-containing protein [Oscillospiraceae bacterium]|nr:DUF1287 domain-containing protein [Oscillospiraceae bacterium]